MPKALFTTNHALPSTDISEKEEVAYGKEGHGALGWSETFFSFLFFFPHYFQFNNLAIPLRLPCAQHWAGFTSTATQGLEGSYGSPHFTDKDTGSERVRALP